MRFLDDMPRFVFFTGKGGVGKTSLACATAVHLAGAGRRVLLVSTDPASNVGQVFDQPIGNRVTAVAGVAGLDALEIDPESAADQYRERIIAPVRGLLPAAEIASITEQLSGSCTTEIASFNEFTGFLAEEDSGYDHVVFDTAPTGHTIRLLQLPGDWTSFIDSGGDASCLGPMSGLDKHRDQYGRALAALTDPATTRLVLVARPQATSLAEAERTASELAGIGIHATHLVVNAVLPADDHTDPLAAAVRAREAAALASVGGSLAGLPRDLIALKPVNMVGVPALRALLSQQEMAGTPTPESPSAGVVLPGLDALVDELAGIGHGLVMCVGKGGVGKTAIAAAIAVGLAARGHRVHLTTTDPAAHLDATITESAGLPTLTLSRVDPAQAIVDYRAHVMATRGKDLDADARAALAEDLQSPCHQEIAVFQQFSSLVGQARRQFVVMDTAPTGHTLLLMDTTGAYHRDTVTTMAAGVRFTTPLMRLQDPDYTRLVMVTLPEPTPVLEALAFRDDLARAGITPWAWVINQSLAAAHPTAPLLRRRAHLETEPIATVTGTAARVAVVPLLLDEPVGAGRLLALAHNPEHPMTNLTITWQRLVDAGQTCPRCGETGSEVRAAAATLTAALTPLGITVRLDERAIGLAEFEQAPLESNRILIDARPVEDWLGGATGQSPCCDVCGPHECRTVTVEDTTYETVPADLIVRAGLLAAATLLAGPRVPDPAPASCCGVDAVRADPRPSCCETAPAPAATVTRTLPLAAGGCC